MQPQSVTHTMVLELLVALGLLVCLFTSPLSHVQCAGTKNGSDINVWPKPRNFSWYPPQLTTPLSPAFTINTPNVNHTHLSAAINRYLCLIQTEHHRPLVNPAVNLSSEIPPLQSLTLTVSDPDAPLHHGVDESYSLTIPLDGSANLTSQTVWGAMRGLETFSQLVWGNPSRVAVGLYVWDSPLFAHRGVLLDTSRNYYQVEDILRTIEAMSMNKLNVFHWHITDSQSFPLVVPSEPGLAHKGSYGSDMQYSPADVGRIVQFGLEHGVRVVPEIDAPGHTGSWALSHPEIVSCANKFWWPAETEWPDRFASEPGTGQLNPLNPKTYEVLNNVINYVTTVFPEPFYHAGADEIIPGCWKSDPTIQNFLSNDGTLSQLLEIFINKTLPSILCHNRTAVYWEDVLLDNHINVSSKILPKEYVILQAWNNPKNTKKIVSLGYRAIVSSAQFYYLDCGHGTFVGNNSRYDDQTGDNDGDSGSWCGPYKTWQTIYNYDITYGLSEEEAGLVLGGEVALWSEQADPSVLDSRIWPRSSAAAETWWSGNRDERGVKRYAEVTDRLNELRSRMVKRGIRAEPIQPLWCVRNPGMCNTVHPI